MRNNMRRNKKKQFSYLQDIEITEGFYKGYTGRVQEQKDKDTYTIQLHEVDKTLTLEANQLKKLSLLKKVFQKI